MRFDRGTRGHAFVELSTTPGAVVVIEACANAGWVHDRAVAAGRTR